MSDKQATPWLILEADLKRKNDPKHLIVDFSYGMFVEGLDDDDVVWSLRDMRVLETFDLDTTSFSSRMMRPPRTGDFSQTSFRLLCGVSS